MYVYRVVDSEGNTIDFYLSKTRNHKAAKRLDLIPVKWTDSKKTMQSVCSDI
jgi:transposase-like protein